MELGYLYIVLLHCAFHYAQLAAIIDQCTYLELPLFSTIDNNRSCGATCGLSLFDGEIVYRCITRYFPSFVRIILVPPQCRRKNVPRYQQHFPYLARIRERRTCCRCAHRHSTSSDGKRERRFSSSSRDSISRRWGHFVHPLGRFKTGHKISLRPRESGLDHRRQRPKSTACDGRPPRTR